MCAKHKWRLSLAVLAIACLVQSLSAVIVEVREYHGKQVTCVHGGLMGVAKACGTEGYARVFTGVVRSSVEKGDTDKLLQLVPDEVFIGDSSDATAITNQACLRTDIQAGDKWLFFLYRDPKSGALVLGYDSPSKAISEAEEDISLVRDLGYLKNAGILVGTIQNLGETEDAKAAPLASHKVVAKNVKNGGEYTAYTNQKGHFKLTCL